MKKKYFFVFGLILFIFFGRSVVEVRGETRPIKIGVNVSTYCTEKENNVYTGFPVEVLQTALKRIRLSKSELDLDHLEYVETTNVEEQITNVIDKKVDVAIGCISVTSERLDKVEFTTPIMNSGLSIMVKNEKTYFPTFSSGVAKILFLYVLIVFIVSHFFWFFERKKNDGIDANYFLGVFDSIWFCVVASTTLGLGDVAPKKRLTKCIVVIFMFISIGLVCTISGNITAEINNGKLLMNFENPSDLKNKLVATKSGTTSEGVLKKYGAKIITTQTIEEACGLLKKGKVKAVVFDTQILQSMVKNDDSLALTGEVFNNQYHSFAVPFGSVILKELNKAIIGMKEDGVYKMIYQKYFGV